MKENNIDNILSKKYSRTNSPSWKVLNDMCSVQGFDDLVEYMQDKQN